MANTNVYRRTTGIIGNDPDVATFIAAAGITGATEIAALNTCVRALKGKNALLKDYWSQCYYLNLISVTSLAAAKMAIKYTTTQTAINIGTNAGHSVNGVQFNGTTKGWDLTDHYNGVITRQDLVMLLAKSSANTIDGVSFGNSGDQLFPRIASSGYRTTSNFGDQRGPGVFIGANDGTNWSFYKDGAKQTPSAEVARTTGTSTAAAYYVGCRNFAGAANFQDDQITTIGIFSMGGTVWTDAEHAELSRIINDYNIAT